MLAKTYAKEQQGPRRIAVALSKGGVGKTSIAVHLAAGLALSGKKVLLVDSDTQGHVSYMLGVQPKYGLAELLTKEKEETDTIYKVAEGFSILAGGKSLAALKRVIGKQDFGGEKVVGNALKSFDKNFDYVFVDTAPGWDALTVNVLFYVQEVLCPVTLDRLAVFSLAEFFKNVITIQKFSDENLAFRFVVPTCIDNSSEEDMEFLRELNNIYRGKMCSPIRYSDSIKQASNHGQSVFSFSPGSYGADDYRSLIRHVADDDTLFR